jgi:hypothetical protein
MELLHANGMNMCITASYTPFPPKFASAYDFLFDWQITREWQRMNELNINCYSAIGIHPRSIPQFEGEVFGVMKIIEDRINLQRKSNQNIVVALGEIGLETGNEIETNIFQLQLELASELKLPVIVHTPKINKKEITMKEIEILESFTEIKCVLEHITQENFLIAEDSNYILGFTMQNNKLNSKVAAELLKEFDIHKRVVLNSDVSDMNNEMGGIINLITHLYDRGFEPQFIDRLRYLNAKEFFKI